MRPPQTGTAPGAAAGTAAGAGRSAAGPTLAVIAREAGVSLATASKVLNGREAVAEATRLRVQDALDRLGYIRRSRFDARRPPLVVDLIAHRLDHPSSAAILQAATRAAEPSGVEIIVSAALSCRQGQRPARGWLDHLAVRSTAGVISHLADLSEAQQQWLTAHGIPHVMIDPAAAPLPGSSTVTSTNEADGRRAAEHLLALGHRRIAVVTGLPDAPHTRARIRGIRSALADVGRALDPQLIRHGLARPEPTAREVRALLGHPDRPTALVVTADAMAAVACRTVLALGLRVPHDLSVVGFDDPDGWPHPVLTTVRRPLADMAARALELVLHPGSREGCDPRLELPTSFAVGDSTAPPQPGSWRGNFPSA